MNRKFISLLMLLFAVVASAQVNVGRIYTIANFQSTDAVPGYILDNSGDKVGIGAMDENSFWEFIPTNNANCYYIKNTVTGRYIQTSKQALNSKVVMGDEPVEFKVLLAQGINNCTYGANVFGVASTDNGNNTDFKDGGTVGLNWHADGFVQSYGAKAGSNPRSFWKILVAPKSPYTGVSLSEATSQPVYIYNVESGMWLQNNDRVTSEWTTRAQLGTRGIDFTVSQHGSGYYLNAGFGSESIATNFFYDTKSPAEWTVADGDRTYSGNTYTMESGTLKFAVRNDIIPEHQDNLLSEDVETSRYLVNFNNKDIASRVVANFQFVTKEERLEKMERATRENPQDATWLVKSADFANNDTRIANWNITGNYTRNGDVDGTWGRGSLILHNTGVEAFSMHQDIDVPNGVYQVQVQGFYRDGKSGDQGIDNGEGGTGNDGWQEGESYVEQKHKEGTEELRAVYFANGVENTLRSIIDEEHTKKMTGPFTWSFSHDGEFYYPNNSFCASRAMNLKRGYVNAPIEVAVTDGKLTIGAKKEEGVAGDWLVVDNFKLTYLGMSTAITDMGYSTYVAPYNIDLSDRSDVIAYKVVSVDKAKNTLTLVSVTEIPAGEAVVLKGAEGGYPFAKSDKNMDAIADNLLKASTGFTTDASQKYYCLSDAAGEVGFYPVAMGQEIPAGKGYLVVEGSNAKHFAFVDDVTTGIKPIDNSYTEKRIYNLAGQRLSGVQKGLNIVNGKKVLNF